MKKVIKIMVTMLLLLALIFVWNKYQETNMNMFTLAEYTQGITEFSRDNEVKYSEHRSYKLKSDKYNDAMLYKTIEVEPNTAYKITCMVKTNNVIPKEENCGAGAFICITDTTEQSVAITGTQDWQMIELKFNSKNRENVNIGIRLGGNRADCIGEAWFSDLKVEKGFLDTNSKWKFGCFVIKNLDVNIGDEGFKENIKISMTDSDIDLIQSDIKRFEKACRTFSGYKMDAECEIIYIDEPITSLTYEDEPGYFVSSFDVQKLIDNYIQASNYDHIFTIIKLDSEKYNDNIEIHDWVGLGYMDYQGIGFSNIRIPSDFSRNMYIYNTQINTFPEEVFLHEFLHSLERNSNEYDFETVNLHDYEKYGYKNDRLEGLKGWYSDYMNKKIYDETSKKYIGLNPKVYTLKPVNNEDFNHSTEIRNVFNEPENIIEEISIILKKAKNNFNIILNNV